MGRSHDRPYPLGSLDEAAVQNRLRPDKLAVTVTTIQSQVDPDTRLWRGGSSNSSEERLTGSSGNAERTHGTIPEGSDLELGMGLGIHRTFEVTQTSSGGTSHSTVGVREHV